MKQVFILGRNVELSVEEVKSFLEKSEISFKIISKVSNGILVETEKKIENVVDKFGGVISIGEVIAEGKFEEITKQLDKQELYFGKGNKLNYVVFDFGGKDFEDIRNYLKYRFKDEKVKATEKKITGRVKLQDGSDAVKVLSNLIDVQFFVFGNCFGKITEVCDYGKIEKRDMEKPVRRNELSISPRLAKILINLSQVKSNETLLDPFCGIGVVLQEALLQKIKVVGIDVDKKAINGAKENLKWFKFDEKNYKLFNGDSSKIKISKVDGIATEPDLGELQKRVPSPQATKKILGEFEKLIIDVINNLKKDVNGKIVFTAPLVFSGKKKFSCDFEKISSQTGLKIEKGFPIDEFRESSFIGRSVVVMRNFKN
ncbi:MAG: methyltransferase domain-containing protein [Candidatus Pacearchaeota archaeon]|jgi:tRNA G10  N-methylase Trm11